MSLPLWALDLAETFWHEAGGPEPYPRRLRQPVLAAPYDLSIKEIADLSIGQVERYLARLGKDWSCGEPERRLRACLLAFQGVGFIFLESTDPPEEQTFSLAHELAHFLRHYRQPRRRAVARLGEEVLEVFDGLRRPTPAERLHGLLGRLSLGTHVHLMHRDPNAGAAGVSAAEREADLLAWELLAPRAEVLARWSAGPTRADRLRLEALLRGDFGLSPGVAGAYAAEVWLAEMGRFGAAQFAPLVDRLRGALQRGRDACSGETRDEPGP